MAARNSAQTYGWVSRLLHLVMALGLIGLLALGYVIASMQVSLANFWLFNLHKSLGITLLALALLRLVWHRISPPPGPVHALPAWQQMAARATHLLLYGLMLALPLAGWVASAATGPDVTVFGLVTLPRIAPVSEAVETTAFALHSALAYLLVVVLSLHVAAALYHQFRLADRSLARVFLG